MARREALRDWAPATLVTIGALGAFFAMILTFYSVYLPRPAGAAVEVACLLMIVAGGLVVVAGRYETFEHVCENCGRTYRDRSVGSVYRARGKEVCSADCAKAIERTYQVELLSSQVDVLEANAACPTGGPAMRRARERLQELAADAPESVRRAAADALKRLEDR